ncbi:MAG: cysteine--tRNA ligase, partial [Desulfobacterales bacterium]|nr:cysteine--tRNA ligase [Desulfobacterales bacterium]
TDVDDKIINRARELGIQPEALAEKYIQEFREDMASLRVKTPTIEPKATEHIAHIIQVIERLMAKDLAYQIEGDVFFAVEKSEGYGKLSGRKLEDMEAGARVEVDARKHNPFDFVLWKTAKPEEPSWESPWGPGRPGWHIECSAMSTEYLGETFDIHGGGKDLIFPHHENEIAQSEGAFGKAFVKYWIHNGFVNINQEKMSKSLGNFLMIREVLESYHPEAVRLFLLSNHYRSPIDFTRQAMDEASSGLDKIYALVDRMEAKTGMPGDRGSIVSGDYWARFCEAMDDDFNTAKGIGVLFDGVRHFNRLLDETGDTLSDGDLAALRTGRQDFYRMGEVLGILNHSPQAYFEANRSQGLTQEAIDPAAVERLIAERSQARKAKDWRTADQIRQKLARMNIVLEDRPDGTVWKFDH